MVVGEIVVCVVASVLAVATVKLCDVLITVGNTVGAVVGCGVVNALVAVGMTEAGIVTFIAPVALVVTIIFPAYVGILIVVVVASLVTARVELILGA